MRFFQYEDKGEKYLSDSRLYSIRKQNLKYIMGVVPLVYQLPKNNRFYLNSPHTLIDYGGHAEKL